MWDNNEKLVNTIDSTVDKDSESSFSSAIEWKPKEIRCSPLLPHEALSLDEKLKRIIYIQQTDQSYHKALNDIRDQSIISVLVEPNFYGRHHRTSVLVIATANNTYIFDQKSLGALFRELSTLLEAELPRKILHYSHRICDLLFYQYNLKIKGIWDTFVALCVARQDRSNYTLRQAISLVLNISLKELTCEELDSPSETRRNFTARPLSKGQLHYLGKLAILQLKLHDRLIYDNICKDLQKMSAKFSCEFSKHKKSDEMVLNMGPGSKAGFDCIDEYHKISTIID